MNSLRILAVTLAVPLSACLVPTSSASDSGPCGACDGAIAPPSSDAGHAADGGSNGYDSGTFPGADAGPDAGACCSGSDGGVTPNQVCPWAWANPLPQGNSLR